MSVSALLPLLSEIRALSPGGGRSSETRAQLYYELQKLKVSSPDGMSAVHDWFLDALRPGYEQGRHISANQFVVSCRSWFALGRRLGVPKIISAYRAALDHDLALSLEIERHLADLIAESGCASEHKPFIDYVDSRRESTEAVSDRKGLASQPWLGIALRQQPPVEIAVRTPSSSPRLPDCQSVNKLADEIDHIDASLASYYVQPEEFARFNACFTSWLREEESEMGAPATVFGRELVQGFERLFAQKTRHRVPLIIAAYRMSLGRSGGQGMLKPLTGQLARLAGLASASKPSMGEFVEFASIAAKGTKPSCESKTATTMGAKPLHRPSGSSATFSQ